jgi:hypothetical protein
MRINRYVLDTNVWVSYLINQEEQALIDIAAGGIRHSIGPDRQSSLPHSSF